MPSYKIHIPFALIMALPFFPNVFLLSLALFGTSIIDFDNHIKENQIIIMFLIGVVLALILYIFNLPSMIGIILILLALIFYISQHRGFMHSIFGIIVISIFLTIFAAGFYLLLVDIIDLKVILILLSIILGFIVLNRKLVFPYVILMIAGIYLTPNLPFNVYHIFGATFLGCLSHVALDLFTSSGVSLFSPLSSRKYHKLSGILIIVIWIIAALVYLFIFSN
ncbi:MAG TPA: metal-dependent hydrolase [Methanobacterium sp.]